MKNKFLILVILAVLINQFFWLAVIPYNLAPDEFSHFWISRFVSKNNFYPQFGQNPPAGVLAETGRTTPSFSGMPGLAYLNQSLFLKLFGGFFESGDWYLLARLSQMVFTPALLLGGWFLGKTWLKNKNKSLILLAGFWPSLTFLSAYINSDWSAVCLTSLFAGLVAYWSKKGVDGLKAAILGLCLGLALLTRYNAFVGLLVFVVYLIIKLIKSKNYRQIIIFSLVTFLTAGWWYVRNLIVYQDLFLTGPFYEVIRNIRPEEVRGYNLIEFFRSEWLWTTFRSSLFSFDWNYRFWPDWFYLGFLTWFIWAGIKSFKKIKKTPVVLSFLVWGLSFSQSFYHSWKMSFQPQGRHLLPAILPLLLVLSFSVPKKILKWLTGLVVGLNIYSLAGLIVPTYYSAQRCGLASILDRLNQIQFGKSLIFSRLVLTAVWLILGLLLIKIFKLYYAEKD